MPTVLGLIPTRAFTGVLPKTPATIASRSMASGMETKVMASNHRVLLILAGLSFSANQMIRGITRASSQARSRSLAKARGQRQRSFCGAPVEFARLLIKFFSCSAGQSRRIRLTNDLDRSLSFECSQAQCRGSRIGVGGYYSNSRRDSN